MSTIVWKGITLEPESDKLLALEKRIMCDGDEVAVGWNATLSEDPPAHVSLYQYGDGRYDACVVIDEQCLGNEDKQTDPLVALDQSLEAAVEHFSRILERLRALPGSQ